MYKDYQDTDKENKDALSDEDEEKEERKQNKERPEWNDQWDGVSNDTTKEVQITPNLLTPEETLIRKENFAEENRVKEYQ